MALLTVLFLLVLVKISKRLDLYVEEHLLKSDDFWL